MPHDRVAPKGWKNLDDFKDGLTVYLQKTCDDLIGKELAFTFEDNFKVTFHVALNESEVLLNGEKRKGLLTAFHVDKDTYMLGCEFVKPNNEDLTIIYNNKTSQALSIYAVAREKAVQGECRVVQQYRVGVLEGKTPTGFVPAPTRDLVGQRLLITYGPNHAYEQIFINSKRYVWHCLKGEQRGHAYSETCTYYKFAEDLYMYSWREMLIPCGTSYFLNYKTNIATGKFIGYTSTGEISHSYAGGKMSVLSKTKFPQDIEPI